jgi:hypothetical protein
LANEYYKLILSFSFSANANQNANGKSKKIKSHRRFWLKRKAFLNKERSFELPMVNKSWHSLYTLLVDSYTVYILDVLSIIISNKNVTTLIKINVISCQFKKNPAVPNCHLYKMKTGNNILRKNE